MEVGCRALRHPLTANNVHRTGTTSYRPLDPSAPDFTITAASSILGRPPRPQPPSSRPAPAQGRPRRNRRRLPLGTPPAVPDRHRSAPGRPRRRSRPPAVRPTSRTDRGPAHLCSEHGGRPHSARPGLHPDLTAQTPRGPSGRTRGPAPALRLGRELTPPVALPRQSARPAPLRDCSRPAPGSPPHPHPAGPHDRADPACPKPAARCPRPHARPSRHHRRPVAPTRRYRLERLPRSSPNRNTTGRSVTVQIGPGQPAGAHREGPPPQRARTGW